MTEIPEKALSWAKEKAEKLSERDGKLLQRAVETSYKNILVLTEEDRPKWDRKLRVISPSPAIYQGIWNWDSAFHAIAISRWDPELAWEQILPFFTEQQENGMYPDSMERWGSLETNLTKPPILFWTVAVLEKNAPNKERTAKAYESLVRNEAFWCNERSRNGLFFYGSEKASDMEAKWESGWDTSPRFDGKIIKEIASVDLCCYMVLAYRCLRFLAEKLEKPVDSGIWCKKEKDLVSRINEVLYHPEKQRYEDTYFADGKGTGIFTPASFLPLWLKIAKEEATDNAVSAVEDPALFFPMLPSVSYSDPQYTATDYWRGPTWLNLSAMTVFGLYREGKTECAEQLRQRLLELCEKEERSIFEYYDSRTGKGLGAPDYGWSAAFLIELILGDSSEPFSGPSFPGE